MKYILILVLLLTGCAGNGPVQQSQPGVKSSAKVHTELAGLYFERAQMGIALQEIELALQSDRNYAPAYHVRGLIHMTLREDKEAEDDFVQSLRLDKMDSEAHNNFGWFLCQRGREQESIPHFMAALKNPLYTTPERAYLNAGLCFQKQGKSADAEEFLMRALVVQPEMGQAMQALAELKFAQGDYATAKKYIAAQKNENLTAGQFLLAVRVERKLRNANAEASYAMQLRQRFPDSREAQLLMRGE